MSARTIIDLGLMPLANNLNDSEESARRARRHPLRVVMEDDLTVRLSEEVPPEEMYGTYLYRSGVNAPYRAHCHAMWEEIAQHHPKRIIDIGGNDGTLLATLRDSSAQPLALVNVDASTSMAKENAAKGIEYVNAYWGDVDVGKADVITSTNVFQHTKDIDKFLAGINRHLDGGVWVLEFPYFLTTVETSQFDQIYHEHYYYWLVAPLVARFREHGLTMLSLREVDMHGGSLRITSTNRPMQDPRAWEPFVKRERDTDFSGWGAKMQTKIESDRAAVAEMRQAGPIAAFGAAAKGCIWLNAVGAAESIEYVVDDTPQKQGKFVPGTALEIVTRARLLAEQPASVIVLAHNFGDHIARSLRPAYRGRITRMIPVPAELPLGSVPCCS